ncbi:phenylacetate-CoA oxygenase subunit PaaJ [Nocardiopsis coralliicola]
MVTPPGHAAARPPAGRSGGPDEQPAAAPQGGPAEQGGPLREAERIAAGVPDPELPMLTVADLGILRGVRQEEGRTVVEITPTYSGCPAVEAIAADIRGRLAAQGHPGAEVRTVLAPPWSTEWITDEGRRKLEAGGIAPPSGAAPVCGGAVPVQLSVRCPNCGSLATRELSRFGSTACKALRVCSDCREPFDHMKPF